MQYAGADKWEAQLKKMVNLLHTRKWKGQGNYSLERFCQHHRNAFVSMQACAEHVAYQLPNEHSRVGYILDAIQNNDPPLQAALANVEEDVGDGTPDNPGKRNNFESAVAYILPKDPVARKREAASKRGIGEISDVDATVAGFGDKPGIGRTGVHLRWHGENEYSELTKEQRRELNQWRTEQRKSNPDYDPKSDKKKGGESPKSSKRKDRRVKKALAAAIEKQVEEKLKEKLKASEEDKEEDEKIKSYIMSLIESSKSSNSIAESSKTVPKPATTSAVTFRSILKKVKNQK